LKVLIKIRKKDVKEASVGRYVMPKKFQEVFGIAEYETEY